MTDTANAQPAKHRPELSQNQRLWLWASGLFLLGVAVRFFLGDFSKTIAIVQDEVRYFNIGRSIYTQGAVAIHNAPTDFQKILYSLFIGPSFILKGPVAQIRAITLINCILASSAVFPVLLFAKRLLQKEWAIITAMALTLALPDMSYTMTFMSENLALPLTLWATYLLWRTLECAFGRNKIILSAISGAVIYLLYLSREMGLALFIAFPLVLAVLALARKTCWKALLLEAAAYFGGFALPFLLCKLTLFAGLGGSYFLDWSVLTSVYGLYYMAYAFFYLLTVVLIGFFFFPVVLPLLQYKRMGRGAQSLYLLACATLLVSLGIVCFTISAQESLGWQMPRMHLRYVSQLFPVFLLLCLSLLESRKALRMRFGTTARVCLILGLGLFVAGVMIFLQPFPINNVIDQTMVKYLTDIFLQPRFILQPADGATARKITLSLGVVAAKIGIIGGVGAVLALLFTRRKRLAAACILLAVLGASMLNNTLSYSRYREEYAIGDAALAEGLALYETLYPLEGGTLVLTNDSPGYQNLLLETYTPAEADFAAAADFPPLDGYRYLLLQNGPYTLLGGAQRLDIPGLVNYSLYESTGEGDIVLQRAQTFPTEASQARTITAYEGYFGSDFAPHKGVYSSTGEGYLVRRHGEAIEPGVYDITLQYQYTGTRAVGETVGEVSLFVANNGVTMASAPLSVGENSVRLENVSIPEFYSDAGLQVYVTDAGVQFLQVDIICIELYS